MYYFYNIDAVCFLVPKESAEFWEMELDLRARPRVEVADGIEWLTMDGDGLTDEQYNIDRHNAGLDMRKYVHIADVPMLSMERLQDKWVDWLSQQPEDVRERLI